MTGRSLGYNRPLRTQKRWQPDRASPTRRSTSTIPIAIVLVVTIAIVYAHTAGFSFINFDDDAYITRNPAVQAGLSWAGVAWAFTTFQYLLASADVALAHAGFLA